MKAVKSDPKNDIKRATVVALAALLMALNIKTFVRTGGLYPGGASGLTILIQRIAQQFLGVEIPYSLVNILLNAFPVYIGFRYIGKKFTLFSCEMILLTGFLTDLIPSVPLTYDTLLISIFWRSDQRLCDRHVSERQCHDRGNGLYFHLFVAEKRDGQL